MRPLLVGWVLVLAATAWAGDVAGGADHPLLTRLSGSTLIAFEQKDFDSVDMSPYLSGPDSKWDGRTTRLRYAMPEGARKLTAVQIERNYEQALKKIGARVLFHDDRQLLARLDKQGTPTWVFVASYNDAAEYELIIVEGAAMAQEVVADAAALKKGLDTDGKVAIYGVFFDTGKAVVKPESAATLEQIAKLLKSDAALRLFVVGHTDGVGSPESNVKLSNERAAAVVQELVKRGIENARLQPAGAGPWCPVASNRADAGRAKNRRVELVERL